VRRRNANGLRNWSGRRRRPQRSARKLRNVKQSVKPQRLALPHHPRSPRTQSPRQPRQTNPSKPSHLLRKVVRWSVCRLGLYLAGNLPFKVHQLRSRVPRQRHRSNGPSLLRVCVGRRCLIHLICLLDDLRLLPLRLSCSVILSRRRHKVRPLQVHPGRPVRRPCTDQSAWEHLVFHVRAARQWVHRLPLSRSRNTPAAKSRPS
jgi:hypothetical protein